MDEEVDVSKLSDEELIWRGWADPFDREVSAEIARRAEAAGLPKNRKPRRPAT